MHKYVPQQQIKVNVIGCPIIEAKIYIKALTTTPIIVILQKGIILVHTFSMIGFKAIPLINHKNKVKNQNL
jgi:hypothetical protein